MHPLNPAVVNADEINRRLRLNINGRDISPGPDPDYPYYVAAPGDTDVRPSGLEYVNGVLTLINSNNERVSLTFPLGVAGMSLQGSVLTIVNTDGTTRTQDLAGVSTLALGQLLAQIPPIVDETGEPYGVNGNNEQVIPRPAIYIDNRTIVLDDEGNLAVGLFEPIQVEVESGSVTIGLKNTFIAPFDASEVTYWTSLTTPSSSGVVTSDLKRNGTSMSATTKSTIGATQNTSLSGAGSVDAVMTITTIARGDVMTVHCDADGTGAAGLFMYIEFIR